MSLNRCTNTLSHPHLDEQKIFFVSSLVVAVALGMLAASLRFLSIYYNKHVSPFVLTRFFSHLTNLMSATITLSALGVGVSILIQECSTSEKK